MTLARPRRTGVILLGLLPLWTYVYQVVLAPQAIETVTSNPPALVGLPLGLLLDAVGGLVMLGGLVALRRVSSTVGTATVLLALTLPAALVVAVAPAVIAMMQLSAT